MKLLDKSVDNLSQRLDKLYPDTTSSNSNNDGINYWKGRKVIPLDKWLKITKADTISRRENYKVKEGLRYYPDRNLSNQALAMSKNIKRTPTTICPT